jgi:oxygen-dependent protoporphyrinogen oxidase
VTQPFIVIGGGIAGLAAAERLAARVGGDRVVLVERERQLGGKIRSEWRDDVLIEHGPDALLGSKPAGIELCERLGLAARLIRVNPQHRQSYVLREGQFHPLPSGLTGLAPADSRALLTTALLSWRGRARALIEPFVPANEDAPESVAAFVRRRFGREVWDRIAEPLVAGILGGDGEQLELASAFPQLHERERRRTTSNGSHGKNGSRSGFVSFPRGMHELVEALEARLQSARVLRGSAVTALQGAPGAGFVVTLADGRELAAQGVVVAVPAPAAAALVRGLDAELADRFAEIRHAASAVVNLAFDRNALPQPPRGTGFVTTGGTTSPLLALSWSSNKFAGRAPADTVLVRAFLGRALAAPLIAASDAEIVDAVRAELQRTLGITAAPRFNVVTRWPTGMPLYEIGHAERRRRLRARALRWPMLQFAGHALDGVGIPDCVASGWTAADALAEFA